MTGSGEETRARIPAGIRVLGSVIMLMHLSSETIHSLLPLIMVTTLGVSATFHSGALFSFVALLGLFAYAPFDERRTRPLASVSNTRHII